MQYLSPRRRAAAAQREAELELQANTTLVSPEEAKVATPSASSDSPAPSGTDSADPAPKARNWRGQTALRYQRKYTIPSSDGQSEPELLPTSRKEEQPTEISSENSVSSGEADVTNQSNSSDSSVPIVTSPQSIGGDLSDPPPSVDSTLATPDATLTVAHNVETLVQPSEDAETLAKQPALNQPASRNWRNQGAFRYQRRFNNIPNIDQTVVEEAKEDTSSLSLSSS